jgi:beta-fructofuranosidase
MMNRRNVLLGIASAGGAAVLSDTANWLPGEVRSGVLARDPLRPEFHLLPARGWMNDPCGPVYWKGRYHMFFQYNPGAAVWGDMHWAHAVSPDMVHWRHLPVALSPTPGGPDQDGCFTGSVLIAEGVATALYTGVQSVAADEATLRDGKHDFRETQCLAMAQDDELRIWKKLAAPVVKRPPPDMAVTGFRDPALWRDGNTWYMVIASGVAREGGMALLYRSPDLRHWEYLHPLLTGSWSGHPGMNPVDTGEMWECPDFFPLGSKYVFIYSTEGKVFWKSGELDRKAMRFHPEQDGELDYGSFYAPKTQLDANGNRILWGWIQEKRPEAEYSRAGWAGMMSLPRVLSLEGGELRMQPASQLHDLRRAPIENAGGRLHLAGPCAEVECTFDRGGAGPLSFVIGDQTGALLEISSDGNQNPKMLRFDDTAVPMDRDLPASVRVHAYIDHSVIEIFVDQRYVWTKRFYGRAPGTPVARVRFGGTRTTRQMKGWALRPISSDRLTG